MLFSFLVCFFVCLFFNVFFLFLCLVQCFVLLFRLTCVQEGKQWFQAPLGQEAKACKGAAKSPVMVSDWGWELADHTDIYIFTYYGIMMKNIEVHSSCEIEDFVETHLCKLCVCSVILRSRVLLGVPSLRIQVGDSP